jgi:hypothetical protein
MEGMRAGRRRKWVSREEWLRRDPYNPFNLPAKKPQYEITVKVDTLVRIGLVGLSAWVLWW